ncbi:MAG: fumarylacetoacetate hydrolase family protein [Pseudomonadota bacterium]
MRLVSYLSGGSARVGCVKGDKVVDLSACDPQIPSTMRGLIEGGDAAMARVKDALADPSASNSFDLGALTLLPVVTDAPKILCVGLNYVDHAKEGGNAVPDYPGMFMRSNRSMIGHGEPMVRPHASDTLDYEAELLVIVGRGGRHISQADALSHVFGYSICNDGSVRAYQRKGAQWTPGKNFDGTGAVGPWIVTPDELPEGADGLTIRSRLNGEVMQNSNTKNMIFKVPHVIAIASEFTTLEPGDMIAMGTPEGVGYPRNPPVFMRPGDVVEVEIEDIGVLRNPVIDESDAVPREARR